MTNNLLEALNNFQFKLVKRTSFINEEDFENEVKPFIDSHKLISIRENVERQESQ